MTFAGQRTSAGNAVLDNAALSLNVDRTLLMLEYVPHRFMRKTEKVNSREDMQRRFIITIHSLGNVTFCGQLKEAVSKVAESPNQLNHRE